MIYNALAIPRSSHPQQHHRASLLSSPKFIFEFPTNSLDSVLESDVQRFQNWSGYMPSEYIDYGTKLVQVYPKMASMWLEETQTRWRSLVSFFSLSSLTFFSYLPHFHCHYISFPPSSPSVSLSSTFSQPISSYWEAVCYNDWRAIGGSMLCRFLFLS